MIADQPLKREPVSIHPAECYCCHGRDEVLFSFDIQVHRFDQEEVAICSNCLEDIVESWFMLEKVHERIWATNGIFKRSK